MDQMMNRFKWYEKQKVYWDEQPTTIDGVLGGYGKYHEMETAYSVQVITEFVSEFPTTNYAFDIGAGIGRNTKFVLGEIFKNVDLLDQSPLQLEKAKEYVPFAKK